MKVNNFNFENIDYCYQNNSNILCISKHDNRAYKLQKINSFYGVMPDTLREITCLNRVKGNINLIKLYDITLKLVNNEIYICSELELCDNNLEDITMNHYLQIINGVNYLDDLGYIHGDLASNILLKNNTVKIIDFGLSQKKYRKYDHHYKPTIIARPLELNINAKNININTIDSFSLGNIYFKLLTGKYIIDYDSVTNDNISNNCISNNSLTKVILSTINISDKYCLNLGLNNVRNNKSPLKELSTNDRKIIGNLIQHNPLYRTNTKKLINSLKPHIKFYNFKFNYCKISKFKNLKIINNINIKPYYIRLLEINTPNDIIYNILFNLTRIKHNNIEELFCVLFWIHNKLGGNNILANDVLKKIKAEIPKNIILLELEILYNNNYNIDSFNAYDLLLEFPIKMHKLVNKMLIKLLPMQFKNSNYSELLKILYIYNNLKKQHKLNLLRLDSLGIMLGNKLNYLPLLMANDLAFAN